MSFFFKLLSSLCLCSVSMLSVCADVITPLSDPSNTGGWVLNTDISDEFNGETIDPKKWFVQGTNGEFYIWKGRAPSQFAPHNVYVQDGRLKIRTQWQPDYPFVGKPPAKQNVARYENMTTGAMISHHNFLYGYMEIRAKIPNGAMTGGFWGTGYQQELDVFELIGKVKQGDTTPESTFITSIHDWRPGHPKVNKVWKYPYRMSSRTAEDFHTYGVEWRQDGLLVYLDGQLLYHATQFEMADSWLLNNPMEVWLDSEVFPWHGIPEQHELPVYFDVDYVRIWQKPTNGILAPQFFGFEGPLLQNTFYKPGLRKQHELDWQISEADSHFLSITSHDDFQYAAGRRSLRFQRHAHVPFKQAKITTLMPVLSLDNSKYTLHFDLWVAPSTQLDSLTIQLGQRRYSVAIPSHTERGKWIEVEHVISHTTSSEMEAFALIVDHVDFGTKEQLWFVDNIQLTEFEE